MNIIITIILGIIVFGAGYGIFWLVSNIVEEIKDIIFWRRISRKSQNYTTPNYTIPTTTKPKRKRKAVMEIPLRNNLEHLIYNDIAEKIALLNEYKIQCELKNNSIVIKYDDMNQIGKFLLDKGILDEKQLYDYQGNLRNSDIPYTRNNIPFIRMDNIIDYDNDKIRKYLKLPESYQYMINHLIMHILPERLKNEKREEIQTNSSQNNRISATTETIRKSKTVLEIPLINKLNETIFNNIVEKTELLNKYKIQCKLKNNSYDIVIEYNDMNQIGKFLLDKGILGDNIPYIRMDNIIDYNYIDYNDVSDDIREYLNLSVSHQYMINHLINYIFSEYKKVKDKYEIKIREENERRIREEKRIKEENERRIREEIKRKEKIERLHIILNKCEAKIEEIKEIIKDFNYSDKKTYEKQCSEYKKSCSKIKKELENIEDSQAINRINNLIDEINQTYKNANFKKNNVSSLSYIMETDEDIDLIEKIDYEDLYFNFLE